MQFVLLIGAKLQHVIATLALEAANVPGAYVGQTLRPRDGLVDHRYSSPFCT